MDKSQFFQLYFFNRTWDNVLYVADTLSNMHGTHKNSPYGQTLRNQKNGLTFEFFETLIVGQTWKWKYGRCPQALQNLDPQIVQGG